MALPKSGIISLADIRAIVQPGGGQFDFNNSDLRYLAHSNFNGGQVFMSELWGKPIAGQYVFTADNYAVNTQYSFICPPYQYITIVVAGGGGGGGGGDNHNAYGAGNNGYEGGGGYPSALSFPGYETHAYGGAGGHGNAGTGNIAAGGGADATGGYGSFEVGTGSPGGAGGAPQQGSAWGGQGGYGGRNIATFQFKISPYYPPYGSVIYFVIGGGGDPAPQNAAPGAPGYVVFYFS